MYADDDDMTKPAHQQQQHQAKKDQLKSAAATDADDGSADPKSIAVGTRIVIGGNKQARYSNARSVVVDGKTPAGRVAVKFDNAHLETRAIRLKNIARERVDGEDKLKTEPNVAADDDAVCVADDKPVPLVELNADADVQGEANADADSNVEADASFDIDELFNFALPMARTVRHHHTSGFCEFIHKDLALRNFVLTADLQPILIDL